MRFHVGELMYPLLSHMLIASVINLQPVKYWSCMLHLSVGECSELNLISSCVVVCLFFATELQKSVNYINSGSGFP